MVVIPKNWVLFSVNFSLAITGMVQIGRILHYQSSDEYKDRFLITDLSSNIFMIY